MKKQIDFPELENSQLDREIKKTMEREFPLPEKVENAQKAAFAQIKRQQEEGTQAYANRAAAKMEKKMHIHTAQTMFVIIIIFTVKEMLSTLE